jgi:hypothetical protein
LGLIAQEIDPILPGLADKQKDGVLGINYVGLVPVLVKAIQEQQDTITTLQAATAFRN